MRRTFRLLTLMATSLVIWQLSLAVAAAHPLGNFTINHYAGLHVGREEIVIDYVLDMAEIPAFQEIQALDTNRNGRPDTGEAAAYHPARCAAIQPQLELRIRNRPALLTLTASSAEFPPGVGGLPTLRLTCTFQTSLALTGAAMQVTFADHSSPTRLGWRELVVTGEEVSLHGNVMAASISNRLTSYPADLLATPLDQRQVTFTVLPSGAPGRQALQPHPTAEQVDPVPGRRGDAFTQLVTRETLSFPALLIALVIAAVWGGMHALSPGHGKTIVGAYLVGSRGTWRHALFLGLITTVTHTTGVFLLGGITLFASHFLLPEQLYPWLGVVSGLLVVSIGVHLFVSRLNSARAQAAHHGEQHHHGHDQHHHEHASDHGHRHGGHHHSHLPPGAGGAAVTWRSLLALGISGGLLPCPSALVVLLSAIALDRAGFGLVLVLAFSVGLAGALTGVGLLFLYAGRLFGHLPAQAGIIRHLPAVSALFIALAGVGVTTQALIQTGVLTM